MIVFVVIVIVVGTTFLLARALLLVLLGFLFAWRFLVFVRFERLGLRLLRRNGGFDDRNFLDRNECRHGRDRAALRAAHMLTRSAVRRAELRRATGAGDDDRHVISPTRTSCGR